MATEESACAGSMGTFGIEPPQPCDFGTAEQSTRPEARQTLKTPQIPLLLQATF